MINEKTYADCLQEKEKEWENLCAQCGGCCGAYDDPCLHLRKTLNGKFLCDIYYNRFGPKETVSGEKFNCVPIKEILDEHWNNDHLCGYKKYLKMPWTGK